MNITKQSIAVKLTALIAVAVMLAVSTTFSVSIAGSGVAAPLAAWFKAVQAGDKAVLETLVSDEAIIELKDLGISQTKAEFIESLDQWVDLNKGAEVLTRQTIASESEAVLDVCYRFSSNEVLNREVFTLSGERITGSVQEKIGETCDGF